MKSAFNLLKLFYALPLFVLLLFSQNAIGQFAADCCDAQPIGQWNMGNPDPVKVGIHSGYGDDKEGFFTCLTGCPGEAEIHSHWFKFECIEAGSFEFVIVPNAPEIPGVFVDYNWTLFENECPCGATTTTASCNTTAPHGPGTSGGTWTGISTNIDPSFPWLAGIYQPPPPSDPPPPSPFNNTIFLNRGSVYYLFVNNVTADLISSFDIFFNGTAIILPPEPPGGDPLPGPGLTGNFAPCPNGAISTYTAHPVGGPVVGQEYNWTLTPSGPPMGNGVQDIQIVWDAPGVYELCVEISEGCDAVTEQTCETIIVNDIPPTFETDSACLGEPYFAGPFVVYAPGVFQLDFVTEAGCDSTVFLTLDALLPSNFFFQEQICQGETYEYEGDEFTESGVYEKTLVNAVGCDSIVTFLLVVLPFEIDVVPERDTISCKKPFATFDATNSVVDDSSIVQWTDMAGNILDEDLIFEPSEAGTYLLYVETPDGCMGEFEVIVDDNFDTPFAHAGNQQEVTCKETEVELNGTNSTQSPFVEYEWSGPGIVSGGNTLTPTVNAEGIYFLTVTNTNSGCTDEASVEVFANTEEPIADAGADGNLDCLITTTTLDGSGSSQFGVYTYQWSGPGIVSGGMTLNPTINQAGAYTIVVTDELNGCTAEATTFVILDETPPNVTAEVVQQIDCNNPNGTLLGTTSGAGTYNWSGPLIISGQNTLNPTVGAPGVYTLSVTTEAGCANSAQTTVVADLIPPLADAGVAQALNCKADELILDGSASSQGSNYIYNWSGPGIQSGGNTINPTVNVIGTYEILVTNTANGCTETASVEVTETPPPVLTLESQSNVDCAENTTGSATVSASDGSPPYNYNWSHGGDEATETNLGAGIYSVTTTDSDGCQAILSVTIEEPPILTSSASATGLSKVGANDGTAMCTSDGGTPPYSFLWSNGETGSTIQNLMPGTYEVTVTDANGCQTFESVFVEDFDCSPVGLTVNSENADCNGAATGTATANVTDGASPLMYAWSDGQTDQTAVNLLAGVYDVTITDDNGCILTEEITIDEPTSLKGNVVSVENVDCFGNATGSASVDASGGTPGYSYLWPSGGTEPNEADLTAGVYEVIITDLNGCEETIEVEVTEPTLLEVSATGTDETAFMVNDGTATATPAGGVTDYTYMWSNGETTPTIENLVPGEYCVTITDFNGCTTTDCYEVLPFLCDVITANFETTEISCNEGNDGTATVTMSGGTPPFSYVWSNGDTGETAMNLSAATYEVTATDVNDCELIETVTLGQPDPIEISVVNITDADCVGSATGAASVDASGGVPGYSFEWSNGVTEPSISDVLQGIYTVTVTDDNDCTHTLDVEIGGENDNEPPTVMTQNITVSLDEFGMATITPNMIDAGSTDNCELGTMSLDISQFNCDNIGDNTVTLTIEDVSGNSASGTAIVTVIDETKPTISCPDDIFSNFCLFPVNYQIPMGEDNCDEVEITLVEGLPSGEIFPLGVTEVIYSATDPSGNETTCSFSISVMSDISTEFSTVEPDCFGEITGEATVTPTGGTPPYNYSWDDPNSQFTQTATDLPAGIYNVTVTDGTGCETITEIEVTEPDSLYAETSTTGPCFGEPMGSATATPFGGTGPFMYQWDDPAMQTTQTAEDLLANTYNVVVTDANGCEATSSVVVAELPEVEIGVDEIVGELGGTNMDGLISVTPTGGSGTGYTFEWTYDGNFFSNEEDLTGLSAGEYCVTVTDSDGCTNTDCYTVDIIENVINPELDNYIKITPNPTSDYLNIEMRLPSQSEVKVDFYDYLGRHLINNQPVTVRENDFRFDLSEFPSGVYLVKLTVDDEILVKRIVVE